jgi:hypothetical protein
MARTPTPTHAVKRPLSNNEIQAVLSAVEHATDPGSLLASALRALFDALLADRGETLDSYTAQHRLNPNAYAIPTAHWTAIAAAITNRAQQWGAAATISLDLVNLMPSSYDDPHVPPPAIPATDYRPHRHDLEITREATDVIAASEQHLRDLRDYFGADSPPYLTALASWHHHLARLFEMGLGARTRISKDGPLSLLAQTASGLLYAIIFRPQRRTCSHPNCHTVIHDDGTTQPTPGAAPPPDHAHTPSYPLDAPHPGQWSAHS